MKSVFHRLIPAVLLLVLPAATALADTSVDSTTMLRFSQEKLPGFAKKEFVPATQFFGLDSDKLGDGNLSFHLYGWGRADLADKSFNNDKLGGSLTYGYLQYRFKDANAQVRLGRFFVREGVVNEQVDGLSARTDLPFGFGVSAFGGATVHTVNIPNETTDGKGDGIFGGRLNYRYGGMLELGVSGVYESKAPNLSPLHKALLFGDSRDHRLLGGDVWFSPHRMVELMGHSSYNTVTQGIAEHSYQLNIKPLKDLVLTGEFNEHHERNLFSSSAMFSSFLKLDNLNERSRSVGGSASYDITKGIEVAGDYKHYTRDLGQADRFGGDVRFTQLENKLRAGIGYHYLRSGPNFAVIPTSTASGSFHETHGYILYDTGKTYFASMDAIAYFFKADTEGKKSAWEWNTSIGYHFTPALSLSGDIGYGQNPQYSDELKGLLRLTYSMNYTGKGGSK